MHVLIGLFSSLIIVGITLPSLCLERNDDPQKLQSMSSHVDPSTSSFYSFENQMVKTILRGGTTLRSGGNLSVEHTKDVAASLVTWLFAAFLGVFSQVKVNADGNLPMEQIKKGFLGRLGVNEASIWSELTVSTVLLLFDKNDDGIISKSEGTSLDQVHFMHLIDVLQNVDADQNGFSAADLQMAFLIESNDPDIEDIKRAYRAVKVSQQEVMDELHRLIDRFLAVDKQPKKPADTPARWMPQAVWGSTKMKVIMTAVIACILALVFWDHKKHKEGSQYRAVTQEVIRQQREQYLQSIGHQDPHNSTNDDLTTQRPNTRRESNEQLHKPSSATSGRLQNSVIASNKAPGDLGPKAKMQSVETVITPKTQEVTEKPAQKPRPKKPEAPQPRVISVEEEVVAVLSHVLDVEVHVRTSHLDQADPMRVLFLQSTDLHSLIIAAATGDSHSLTCAVQASQLGQLFDRRAAREWGKTVSFSTLCWNRSAERQLRRDNSPLITALLVRIKELATNLIITCLTEVISGEENDQDEGLWSSFKPDPNASTEGRQLLECISNWDDDGMTPELLTCVLGHTENMLRGHLMWVKVIRSAGMALQAETRCDEYSYKYSKMLAGLENLLKTPAAKFILLARLKEEITEVKGAMGGYFGESVFGPLLALTTIPTYLRQGTDAHNPNAAMYVTLKGFPKLHTDDVQHINRNISKGRQLVNHAVCSGLKSVFRTDCHVAIEWLSEMLTLNELRTTVVLCINPGDANSDLALSDGFMLNVCAVLLDLCMPFCGNREKLAKVDPSYPASANCHLGYNQEPSLAGGVLLSQTETDGAEGTLRPNVTYNFITQIFHVTLRALNIGFIPALQQFRKQLKIMSDSMDRAKDMGLGDQAKGQQMMLSMQWEAHLMDYDFLESGSRFYLSVCLWINHVLNKATEAGSEAGARRREQLALQEVPEFVVKDMAHWFTFIATHATHVHRNVLDSLQLGDFIEMCVMLLSRRDLLPGPIPASALCRTLLSFVSNSKSHSNSRWSSSVMSNLELAVHSCELVQSDLCPGLIETYVSVDVVEGLDVDKDEFDKFSSRAEIGRLLTSLWSRADCKQSVLRMCGTKQFQSFLGAIFDTLLYQLHDSLSRLANVRKLELTTESWKDLPGKERLEKSQFLRSEERTAKGFMSMATETVELLELLTTSDQVARCLTVMPLAQRAASAFLGFLESLCGSKSADFKVKDMKKYNWEPRLLLLQLTGMVQQVVKQEQADGSGHNHFTTSLATDVDFNPTTMAHAIQVLEDKTIAKQDFVDQFKVLVDMLCDAHAVYSTQRAGGGRAGWEEKLHVTVDQEHLNTVYEQQLSPLRYDSANILETHAYQSNVASTTVDARSKRCRALMKETRMWMDSLPVQAHAAIFLRQDEDRMDVVRAVMTGPHDTPYSLGCFVFDIYFPPMYPDHPPLVKFTTTGGGTVRFNPNLYADGKVCLSLLGTWHGGDASQKWQPGKSSLYQVLLSIQSMILISTPMYNEPGYEGIQGTAEGDAQSRKYNANLRLSTLRHAVLSQITRPPAGFETIVRRHFFLQKTALKKQCYDWLADTDDLELKQKLSRVVEDLCAELDKLENPPDEVEDDEGDEVADDEE